MIYKFTFEDGSEAFAHYGVKGMKWDKHVMAQDPAYLEALGMAGGGAAEFNPMNLPEQAQEGIDNARKTLDGAFNTAKQTVDKFRNWKGPEGLPRNPLNVLAERTKKAEQSGESAAARQRLIDRYSSKPVDKKSATQTHKDIVNKFRKEREKKAASRNPFDFDATKFGYKDNSVKSKRAARGEMFGPLAEKGKMSREKALKIAKDEYREGIKAAKNPEAKKNIIESYKLATEMAKTFRSKDDLNASRKRKNEAMAEKRKNAAVKQAYDRKRAHDYHKEQKVNRGEFMGDRKGYLNAQRRTDDFYGKNGLLAQGREAQRRRRNREEVDRLFK